MINYSQLNFMSTDRVKKTKEAVSSHGSQAQQTGIFELGVENKQKK